MRKFLLIAAGIASLALPVSAHAQTEPDVGEVLEHRYGNTVEWVVRGGQIVFWKSVSDERGGGIPQPTAAQIKGWLTDPSIITSAKAAALDPEWRAIIAALCVMTACTDEDAAWAAFLSALP